MKVNTVLPIGSVVLLKGASKKLMILGYLKYGLENKSDVYDYAACTYPEGFISPQTVLIFNHNQIETVCAVGYQNEEQTQFVPQLLEGFARAHSKHFLG